MSRAHRLREIHECQGRSKGSTRAKLCTALGKEKLPGGQMHLQQNLQLQFQLQATYLCMVLKASEGVKYFW